MFRDLLEVEINEAGYLVDDRGIIYKRTPPLKATELGFLGLPFACETLSNVGEYSKIVKEIEESSPEINAWLDAGSTRVEKKIIELPDIDINGSIHREKREVIQTTKKIEFYHLGE